MTIVQVEQKSVRNCQTNLLFVLGLMGSLHNHNKRDRGWLPEVLSILKIKHVCLVYCENSHVNTVMFYCKIKNLLTVMTLHLLFTMEKFSRAIVFLLNLKTKQLPTI